MGRMLWAKARCLGVCRRSGCREEIGLAAADKPAVAVGVSSVQKDDRSSAGEGLKCQTEVGALGKGDPPKASEKGWNLAKPGFRKISLVVAEAGESGYKPNASWRLCRDKNTRMEALGWKMSYKSQSAADLMTQGQALAVPAAPPLTELSGSAQVEDVEKQALRTLPPLQQAKEREARATEFWK